MPESDEYRVWLSAREQEQLLEQMKEHPERQLAARAMLHGLRNDELRWVRLSEIRELQCDREAYKLRVRDGKTGYREVPISRELVQQMRMFKNATSTRKNKPLIKKAKRTRRSWITKASEALADETKEVMQKADTTSTPEPNATGNPGMSKDDLFSDSEADD